MDEKLTELIEGAHRLSVKDSNALTFGNEVWFFDDVEIKFISGATFGSISDFSTAQSNFEIELNEGKILEHEALSNRISEEREKLTAIEEKVQEFEGKYGNSNDIAAKLKSSEHLVNTYKTKFRKGLESANINEQTLAKQYFLHNKVNEKWPARTKVVYEDYKKFRDEEVTSRQLSSDMATLKELKLEMSGSQENIKSLTNKKNKNEELDSFSESNKKIRANLVKHGPQDKIIFLKSNIATFSYLLTCLEENREDVLYLDENVLFSKEDLLGERDALNQYMPLEDYTLIKKDETKKDETGEVSTRTALYIGDSSLVIRLYSLFKKQEIPNKEKLPQGKYLLSINTRLYTTFVASFSNKEGRRNIIQNTLEEIGKVKSFAANKEDIKIALNSLKGSSLKGSVAETIKKPENKLKIIGQDSEFRKMIFPVPNYFTRTSKKIYKATSGSKIESIVASSVIDSPLDYRLLQLYIFTQKIISRLFIDQDYGLPEVDLSKHEFPDARDITNNEFNSLFFWMELCFKGTTRKEKIDQGYKEISNNSLGHDLQEIINLCETAKSTRKSKFLYHYYHLNENLPYSLELALKLGSVTKNHVRSSQVDRLKDELKDELFSDEGRFKEAEEIVQEINSNKDIAIQNNFPITRENVKTFWTKVIKQDVKNITDISLLKRKKFFYSSLAHLSALVNKVDIKIRLSSEWKRRIIKAAVGSGVNEKANELMLTGVSYYLYELFSRLGKSEYVSDITIGCLRAKFVFNEGKKLTVADLDGIFDIIVLQKIEDKTWEQKKFSEQIVTDMKIFFFGQRYNLEDGDEGSKEISEYLKGNGYKKDKNLHTLLLYFYSFLASCIPSSSLQYQYLKSRYNYAISRGSKKPKLKLKILQPLIQLNYEEYDRLQNSWFTKPGLNFLFRIKEPVYFWNSASLEILNVLSDLPKDMLTPQTSTEIKTIIENKVKNANNLTDLEEQNIFLLEADEMLRETKLISFNRQQGFSFFSVKADGTVTQSKDVFDRKITSLDRDTINGYLLETFITMQKYNASIDGKFYIKQENKVTNLSCFRFDKKKNSNKPLNYTILSINKNLEFARFYGAKTIIKGYLYSGQLDILRQDLVKQIAECEVTSKDYQILKGDIRAKERLASLMKSASASAPIFNVAKFTGTEFYKQKLLASGEIKPDPRMILLELYKNQKGITSRNNQDFLRLIKSYSFVLNKGTINPTFTWHNKNFAKELINKFVVESAWSTPKFEIKINDLKQAGQTRVFGRGAFEKKYALRLVEVLSDEDLEDSIYDDKDLIKSDWRKWFSKSGSFIKTRERLNQRYAETLENRLLNIVKTIDSKGESGTPDIIVLKNRIIKLRTRIGLEKQQYLFTSPFTNYLITTVGNKNLAELISNAKDSLDAIALPEDLRQQIVSQIDLSSELLARLKSDQDILVELQDKTKQKYVTAIGVIISIVSSVCFYSIGVAASAALFQLIWELVSKNIGAIALLAIDSKISRIDERSDASDYAQKILSTSTSSLLSFLYINQIAWKFRDILYSSDLTPNSNDAIKFVKKLAVEPIIVATQAKLSSSIESFVEKYVFTTDIENSMESLIDLFKTLPSSSSKELRWYLKEVIKAYPRCILKALVFLISKQVFRDFSPANLGSDLSFSGSDFIFDDKQENWSFVRLDEHFMDDLNKQLQFKPGPTLQHGNSQAVFSISEDTTITVNYFPDKFRPENFIRATWSTLFCQANNQIYEKLETSVLDKLDGATKSKLEEQQKSGEKEAVSYLKSCFGEENVGVNNGLPKSF